MDYTTNNPDAYPNDTPLFDAQGNLVGYKRTTPGLLPGWGRLTDTSHKIDWNRPRFVDPQNVPTSRSEYEYVRRVLIEVGDPEVERRFQVWRRGETYKRWQADAMANRHVSERDVNRPNSAFNLLVKEVIASERALYGKKFEWVSPQTGERKLVPAANAPGRPKARLLEYLTIRPENANFPVGETNAVRE